MTVQSTFKRRRRLLLVALILAGQATYSLVSPLKALASVSATVLSSSVWTDSINYHHIVGELQNNGTENAEFVKVNLNYYDASNTLIGTGFTYSELDVLAPSEKSPFVDLVSPSSPSGFDHYSITGVTASAASSPPNHNFQTVVTNVFTDVIGYQHIVGTVTNNNSTTASFVKPVFTFYNGTGGVVDEDFTYINTDSNATLAPSPASASFELLRSGSAPAYISRAIVTQSSTASTSPPPAMGPGQFKSTAPTRILDTRPSYQVGPYSTPFGPGGVRNLQITGASGVPGFGVVAVVLNVTVTDTTAPSFLTIWPAGAQRPNSSSLNWVPGLTVPNLVTVQVGQGGQISIYNLNGSVDVIVDVAGWIAAPISGPDGLYNPLSPARIMDTRSATQVGPYNSSFGPGTVRNLQIGGRGGVPAVGVSAVVLNVTATNTSLPGDLTIWPAGSAMPVASNLNWAAGTTVPNRVTVKVGTGGQISIFNLQGAADVIIDVGGWYTDSANGGAGAGLTPVVPGRILDTRPSSQVGPYNQPLQAGSYLLVPVAGRGNVPSTAVKAVVLNVTVTDTSAPSFLTAYPSDLSQAPLISDLNWVQGQTVPNMVVVKLGADGNFKVYSPSGSVDVIVDVLAWYG